MQPDFTVVQKGATLPPEGNRLSCKHKLTKKCQKTLMQSDFTDPTLWGFKKKVLFLCYFLWYSCHNCNLTVFGQVSSKRSLAAADLQPCSEGGLFPRQLQTTDNSFGAARTQHTTNSDRELTTQEMGQIGHNVINEE
jgi:hypothetical protein